ncbi:hypothetical protein KCU81_g6395, partial [Aureobasidium melanogenum]|uniref:Uncharacterized protein n=1 Tax=Aureobasidium melanogenum (strain CBS 110374) TaxID=1043003 RepID=A0A074VLM1_AURM1
MPSTTSCLSSPNTTPFLITVQDAILLEDSEGFSILRDHLSNECCNDFCKDHETDITEDKQAWILMRDILHALLAPVVALHDHTTRIAQKYTKATKPEDIEFAFRNKGRNAFVWLTSFLADDEDWCLSKNCPACVVQHALDAEFQIRLMAAACMLSCAKGPEPGHGPTLPSFDFFLRSLRDALKEDELWGPDYYEYVEPKAEDLNLGMQDLMRQCEKLELSMTPPGTPEDNPLPSFSYFSERRMSLMTPTKTIYPRRQSVVPGITIKRSKLAKVQMKMAQEEEQWLQSFVNNAWQTLNPFQMELPSMNTIARRMSLVAGP